MYRIEHRTSFALHPLWHTRWAFSMQILNESLDVSNIGIVSASYCLQGIGIVGTEVDSRSKFNTSFIIYA